MKIGKMEVFRLEDLPEKVQADILDKEREDGVFPHWWDYIENELKEYLEQQGLEFDKMEFDGFYSQGDGARISLTLKINEEGHENSISELIRKGNTVRREKGTNNLFEKHYCFFPEILEKDPTLFTLMDYLSTSKYTDYRGKAPMGSLRIAIYPGGSPHYVHENTLTSETDPDVDWNDDFWTTDSPLLKDMTHEDFLIAAVDLLETNLYCWTQDLSRLLYQKLETEYESLTSDESVREMISHFGPEWAEGYVWNTCGQYVGHLLIHPLEEEC